MISKKMLIELLHKDYGWMQNREVQHTTIGASKSVGIYDVFIDRTLNDEFDVYEIYFVFADSNTAAWKDKGYKFRICAKAPEKYLERWGDDTEKLLKMMDTKENNFYNDLFGWVTE